MEQYPKLLPEYTIPFNGGLSMLLLLMMMMMMMIVMIIMIMTMMKTITL
jgi:hypothetical protein